MDFFNRLFGTSMSPVASFVLVFVAALVLFGAAIWLYNVLRGRGMTMGIGLNRGRQPRLAVLDYTDVDNRRRLVLIRRDNVEHLLLIGGATEIVVEQNIVRGVPVQTMREPSILREVVEPPPAPVDLSEPVAEPDERLSARDQARKAAGIVRPAAKPASDPFFEPAPVLPPEILIDETVPHLPLTAAPVVAPPVKVEPARVEPARIEPARVEPLRPEPPVFEAPKPPVVPPKPPAPEMPKAEPPKAPAESLASRLEQAMRRPMNLGRSEPKIEPPKVDHAPHDLPKAEPAARPAVNLDDASAKILNTLQNLKTPVKGEPPKADVPKIELPKAEAPKTEPLKVDAPKIEAPKVEPPKPAALTQQEKMVFDSLEEEMASLLGRAPKK